MKITSLTKSQLDNFVSSQPHSQFLQSWDWGEMQKKVGHLVWRFGLTRDDNDELLASAQMINQRLPLNKGYLYCPRGPVISHDKVSDERKNEILKIILGKARDITIETTQTEEIFFRLEPTLNGIVLERLRQTRPVQPATTLTLNLNNPADKLFAGMSPKNRYNIKLAEKHGVTAKQLNSEDFEKAWPLFNQTSHRDKFNLHPKIYYQTMLTTVPWIRLWGAEKEGQLIAANIIGYYGDTVTYIHGASDYAKRNLMAPHLLQWKIITDAQAEKSAEGQKFCFYDFHGIAETDDPNHPWAGLTRFKKGFGGQVSTFPGCYDYVYENTSYQFYKMFRKINLFLMKHGK